MIKIDEIGEMTQEKFEELFRENQDLKNLAFLMSHDLKTPLRHVKLYTNNLRENLTEKLKIDDPDTNYVCSVIESSVEKMDDMIDNLLSLWGVKRNSMYFEDVDLNSICSKVAATILETISSEKQVYKVEWKNLPTIKADKTQVFQLLMNLCLNAVKYLAKGKSPSVLIDVKDREDDWLISVTDNGIGISEQDRKVIFKPFVRLNKDGIYPGNGLGLSICKRIVHNHKGKIWVESPDGDGSIFYFTVSKNL